MRATFICAIAIAILLPAALVRYGSKSDTKDRVVLNEADSRTTAFVPIRDFAAWDRPAGTPGETFLVSPELTLPMPSNEVVVWPLGPKRQAA